MPAGPRTHVAALTASLKTLTLADVDKAAVKLAMEYAARLDALGAGRDASRIGPAYLNALESLGLTPRARNATGKQEVVVAGPRPLDQLRARRARTHGTPTVDTATP